MNCDSNAPFVACWGRMHLHTHRRHLRPDYSGSLQNRTQFCFLMEVAKAKSKQSNSGEYEEEINRKPTGSGCKIHSTNPKQAL